jgi:hypothetical protein
LASPPEFRKKVEADLPSLRQRAASNRTFFRLIGIISKKWTDLAAFHVSLVAGAGNYKLRQLKNMLMLTIKIIDEANTEDYPMNFAYNEKRKSATLSLAGRYSIIDAVNTIDDLFSLISAKVKIAIEGSIGEQIKARILHGESIFVVDRQAKALK